MAGKEDAEMEDTAGSSGSKEDDALLCRFCLLPIGEEVHIRCDECPAVICVQCFRLGAEGGRHRRGHNYEVVNPSSERIFEDGWTFEEEADLLAAAHKCKLGNWGEISDGLKRSCEPKEARQYFDVHFVRSALGQIAIRGSEWMLKAFEERTPIDEILQEPAFFYNAALEALRAAKELPNENDDKCVEQVRELTRSFILQSTMKKGADPNEATHVSHLNDQEWWDPKQQPQPAEKTTKSTGERQTKKKLCKVDSKAQEAKTSSVATGEAHDEDSDDDVPLVRGPTQKKREGQVALGIEPEESEEDAEQNSKRVVADVDMDEDEVEDRPTPIIVVKKIQARGRTKLKAELQHKTRVKAPKPAAPVAEPEPEKEEEAAEHSDDEQQPTVSVATTPVTSLRIKKSGKYQGLRRRRVVISSDEDDEAGTSTATSPKRARPADSALEEEMDEEEERRFAESTLLNTSDDNYDSDLDAQETTKSGKPLRRAAKPKRRAFGTTKRERRMKYLKRKLQLKSRKKVVKTPERTDDGRPTITRSDLDAAHKRRPFLTMDREESDISYRPKIREDDAAVLAYNVDRDDYEMEQYNEAEQLIARLTFTPNESDRILDIENEVKIVKVQRMQRILRDRRSYHRRIVANDMIPEFFKFMTKMCVEKKKATDVIADRTPREHFEQRLRFTFNKEEINSIVEHKDRVQSIKERIAKLKELQATGVTSLKGHEELKSKRKKIAPIKPKRKLPKYEREKLKKDGKRVNVRWQRFKQWSLDMIKNGRMPR